MILGGDYGPLRGGARQVLSLQTPETFVREAARLSAPAPVAAPAEALAHLLTVRGAVAESAREFERALARLPAEPVAFPATPVGRQLRQVARLLLAGLEIPVFKVEVGGFDTHFGQGARHARLWGQLAEALAAFRRTLRAAGQWDRVLVLSVSEFGRRVGENASQGTDHGAAAAQFALGGRVKGGFYGEPPSLHDLDRGDLRHRVDVRRLYGEIARVGWGQGDAGAARLGATEPGLGFL